jgi:aminopeptidase N
MLFAFCLFPFSLWAQTKADTLHVTHYDIHLEIKNLVQQEIKGYTDIYITAKIAPLTNINLDFFALTVDSIKKSAQTLVFLHEGHRLNIDLPFSTVGQEETVRVYYRGKPATGQFGGFHFSADNNFAYNMGVSMVNIPHSIGRFWYPCIDDFNDKSTYTFNITTDLDKKAICGGMLVDSANLGNAMRWTWELTDPIPTYLASVAVGNYQVYRDTVHSISGDILPIEIYANPETLPKIPGSFVNLKTFFHTFEKRWGAHRWPRVGYVCVPFFDGAMEHATNIAYPQSYVRGTTANQNIIAHELAHSWFGNLITCSTSQNMWINEGFATYGALLCDEILDPTLQTYKKGIRDLHANVLRRAHLDDGGYFALNNVPPNSTYGTTSYDKGGLVAHTLRYYMGDDLYFSSITELLDNNQYGNIDSEEFFDQLSQISGLNLHDFYLGWVHQPGFLNFNIDSIKSKGSNIYEISLKQKLHKANYFANNNLIDVEFVSASGERHLIERMRFSGEHKMMEVEIPFEPIFWAIDPNHKKGDACFKYTQLIEKTGITNLPNANLRIQVDEFSDTSIIRVEHNLVVPTPSKKNHPNIVKISEKHFWRIGFLQYSSMQATYSFNYNITYDAELLQGYTKDDLVLLYRKDAAHDWQIVPAIVSGNNQSGTLVVNTILSGEYTFAISNGVKVTEWENEVLIYPNPVLNELRIINYELQVDEVRVFDVFGRNVEVLRVTPNNGTISINVSHLPVGIYFIQMQTNEGTVTKKVIKK